MHFAIKPLGQWFNDNRAFIMAYNAAEKDDLLKAEVRRLEIKYIRKHLEDLVGEDDAERIMADHGC